MKMVGWLDGWTAFGGEILSMRLFLGWVLGNHEPASCRQAGSNREVCAGDILL